MRSARAMQLPLTQIVRPLDSVPKYVSWNENRLGLRSRRIGMDHTRLTGSHGAPLFTFYRLSAQMAAVVVSSRSGPMMFWCHLSEVREDGLDEPDGGDPYRIEDSGVDPCICGQLLRRNCLCKSQELYRLREQRHGRFVRADGVFQSIALNLE